MNYDVRSCLCTEHAYAILAPRLTTPDTEKGQMIMEDDVYTDSARVRMFLRI
jgi:hypothetical protein